jgi:hypothetical protein
VGRGASFHFSVARHCDKSSPSPDLYGGKSLITVRHSYGLPDAKGWLSTVLIQGRDMNPEKKKFSPNKDHVVWEVCDMMIAGNLGSW